MTKFRKLALDATRSGLNSWQSCYPGLKQPWALGRNRFAVPRKCRHKPILSAVDTTIKAGRVGVGAFDDIAEFRNIKDQGYR